MRKLIIPTIRTIIIGVVVLGLLLFLPAWTLGYWQAWVFIAVFMSSVTYIGLYLSIKDPELLERRKQVGPAAESRPTQKIISSLAILAFLGLLVFSAFDHRFGWSAVPPYVSAAGDVLVALGLYITLIVLKENRYSASSIRTTEDQKVISSGLYALVRHPMYAGAMIMVIGIPIALGSLWGLAVVALVTPVLVWRILDEEKFLLKDLPGYGDYMQKVRYRLAPHIW